MKPIEKILMSIANGNPVKAELIRQEILLDHPNAFHALYNGTGEVAILLSDLDRWHSQATKAGEPINIDADGSILRAVETAVAKLSKENLAKKKPHERKCYQAAVVGVGRGRWKEHGRVSVSSYTSQALGLINMGSREIAHVAYISRAEAQTLPIEQIYEDVKAMARTH